MHRGRCDYPPWDTESGHGTLTASVAAGGRAIVEQPFPLAHPPLRLHLYGLGAPGKPVVSSDIGNALEAAREAAASVGSFPIVNVSYMTQDDFSAISAVFARPRRSGHQRELAIVAAGNAPSQDLDVMERPISPASYGREESWNVLTVGALRPDGHLLSSSKFGEYTVGLAAPGCGVAAWGKDDWTPVDGTSIAAPVVTFTAALLRAEGLRNSRQILHRLLVSAERSDKLAGYVRDGRVLNVPDAITVFEDVVVLEQDGVKSRVIGRIQTTDEIARDRFVSALNGERVPAKVARIDRITLSAPSQWRAVATLEDVGAGDVPLLRTKSMQFGSSTLTVLDQAGELQTINFGDVSHIIYRSIDLAAAHPGRPYEDNFATR
jgi:subtilisin family serine protease